MRLQVLPSVDLLRTFEAAARSLSFTKAAQELFVTPSAVSRQIRMLEENLGVPLYLRGARGLRLTDAGLRLQQAVSGAWHQLEAALLTLKQTQPSRVLSIGTTVSFAALWLVPRLPAFRLRHPDIDIRVNASSEVQDTRRERLDVVIRYARPGLVPQRERVLFHESVVAVCSPGLCQGLGRGLVAPADLAQQVLLHLDDACGDLSWYRWGHWLESVGLANLVTARALRFSHYDQLIQAALDGQGVALGRLPLIDRLLSQGRLVAPFSETPLDSGAYYVMTHPAPMAHPDAELFASWLLESAASGDAA
ncbi:LysR substrate-binding domain-containing protein [Ideonella sp. YS5]|uniref:LysR substrate-binding domain-containing protein n=1 Tax=Ideonella sp. YS5 TaxID=3453714 RepID=UPI003EEB4305